MDELRLEFLTFVGYERLQAGQPGEAPPTSGRVHLVTLQGASAFLHLSPTLCSPHSVALSPPPPPSAPPRPQLEDTNARNEPLPPVARNGTTGATQPSLQRTAGGGEASEKSLLHVLTTTSVPPDDFEVEFVHSASSASSASSRSPSAQETPIAAEGDGHARDAAGQREEAKDSKGVAPPALPEDKQEEREAEAEAELQSMNSGDAVLPPNMEHGIELTVREEDGAQLDRTLTRCALKLFNGQLPQQQQTPQLSAEERHQGSDRTNVPSSSQQQPQLWSEAAHYHRVMLMGYDSAGAVAYLMAVPFAQKVPPLSSWRLFPLPLLLCPVTQLTHLYSEVQQQEEKDAGEQHRNDGTAAAAASPQRFPVLPRWSFDCNAESAQSSHVSSPPRRVSNTLSHGSLLAPPQPRPPAAATAAAALPPSSSSLCSTSPDAYLSPPLRWHFPAIGHIPALSLPQIFQVVPTKVYQLARPVEEEVVFVGVACGVPWVREVVVSRRGANGEEEADDASAAAAAAEGARRGTALSPHTSSASASHASTTTTTTTAAVSAAPPPGYRWKDPRGYVVPLVSCHDARDLRGRYGLVDVAAERPPQQQQEQQERRPSSTATLPPTALSPSATVFHPDSEKKGDEAEGENLRTHPPHPAEEGEAHDTPPTHITSTAAAAATAAATAISSTGQAPLYVKKGTMVFVPGRFGVMLECVAKPTVLETHFGVAHGDRLVQRIAPSSPLPSSHDNSNHHPGLPLAEIKEMKEEESPTTTAAVAMTVMGAYQRNVLVVLTDGASQATLFPIHRGVAEVAELFRKVAGAPLPPPALPLEDSSPSAPPPQASCGAAAPSVAPQRSKDEATLKAAPAPVAAAAAAGAVMSQDSIIPQGTAQGGVEEVPVHLGPTSIFVEEDAPDLAAGKSLRKDVAAEAPGEAEDGDSGDDDDDETVPLPTTSLLAPAEEVTITSASATPTTAVPPVGVLPAVPHHVADAEEQRRRTPFEDSSLPTAHVRDENEYSGSAQVLSSDHTPSILPTPSASLARRLQSECDQEDEGVPSNAFHRAGEEGIDRRGGPSFLEEVNTRVAVPAVAVEDGVPLSSGEGGLSAAAAPTTAHEASAARSSASPAAVMPESYYASESSGVAAAATLPAPPQALATPPTTHANDALLHEGFTPSYSPPAGPADGHTAPRRGVPRGDGRSYDGDTPDASLHLRPLSTAASAAVTPAPFTNFMKAFAVFALRQPADGHAKKSAVSSTGSLAGEKGREGNAPAPLCGLQPILDFYRAQPLVRVTAATESRWRCRAAWCGDGSNAAVQDLKESASTTVFEDLCVDELIALLRVV